MLIAMATFGYFGGGHAKMDWIYKELRRQQDEGQASSNA